MKLDATERKTISAVTFLAGCLLLAPRQWVSAGILLVVSVVLFGWHVRSTRRTSGPTPARSRAPK